jgi:hypothetical protein
MEFIRYLFLQFGAVILQHLSLELEPCYLICKQPDTAIELLRGLYKSIALPLASPYASRSKSNLSNISS